MQLWIIRCARVDKVNFDQDAEIVIELLKILVIISLKNIIVYGRRSHLIKLNKYSGKQLVKSLKIKVIDTYSRIC